MSFFCHRESKTRFDIGAIVIPNLTIHHEKVEKNYLSSFKHVTSQEFQYQDDAQATIKSSKYSRDKCWEICIEGGVFKKSEIDLLTPKRITTPMQGYSNLASA